MRSILLVPLLLLAPPALPTIDLDGDGNAEKMAWTDAGLRVGDGTIPCGDPEFPCDVHALDIRSSDSFKELSVCEHGPRDDISCQAWTLRGGEAKQIELKPADGDGIWPAKLTSTGNGYLLSDAEQRTHTRRDKFVLSTDGLSVRHVPQPMYYVNYELHVDRTFPITFAEGGGDVVANVRPDSDIVVVMERRSGAVMVKISSGLVGWTTWATLTEKSDHLMMLMSAG